MVALAIIVASSSSLVVVVAFVVSFVRGKYNRSRGGSRNTLHGYTEYGAPTSTAMESCPITDIHPQPRVIPRGCQSVVAWCTHVGNGPGNEPLAQNRFNSIKRKV